MWPNPQETADVVTFTEEVLNGKLHFCFSVCVEKILILNVQVTVVLLMFQEMQKHCSRASSSVQLQLKHQIKILQPVKVIAQLYSNLWETQRRRSSICKQRSFLSYLKLMRKLHDFKYKNNAQRFRFLIFCLNLPLNVRTNSLFSELIRVGIVFCIVFCYVFRYFFLMYSRFIKQEVSIYKPIKWQYYVSYWFCCRGKRKWLYNVILVLWI